MQNTVTFTCNITGQVGSLDYSQFHREGGFTSTIPPNVRLRSIIYMLLDYFKCDSKVLSLMTPNKNIKGLGISDDIYHHILADKFSYVNTFFDKDPKLDITNLSNFTSNYYDFIICTDVFEHICEPIEKAFTNLNRLLKIGGICIFSVPYHHGNTVEHFPDTYKYELYLLDKQDTKNEKLLDNEKNYVVCTYNNLGQKKMYNNLIFHGGIGNVLEMRLFGYNDILKYFKNAGFECIKNECNNILEYGIINNVASPFLFQKKIDI